MEWIRTFLLLIFLFPALANGMTRHYKFNIVMRKMTRLCSSKPIVTVNGQYPGPTLSAREGDNIIVKVVNHVQYNVTIHWHGVKQIRTGWADGPAYITQCPIPPGQSYVYNFTLVGQRGTLWYHAHILWLRATVHGALIIKPKLGVPYPFPKPHEEAIVILGEWWKADTEAVINQAMRTGTAPNVSDAHMINGHPGPIAGCPSSQGGYELKVRSGKTYMLRIINAALNDDLFLKIAGHELRVVEADAVYTKPFYIDTAVITPGQTTNVLLTADKPAGRYLITASPYMDAMAIAIDNRTATATLIYDMDPSLSTASALKTARVPQRNDTAVAATFSGSLRSLNSKNFPANVPQKIDHSLFFTVGLGINRCRGCINGSRVVAAMNNVSFVMPETALLEAHFFNKRGVFTTDFPRRPPVSFDYTGSGPKNMQTTNGTRLYRLPYNSTVEIVLQDTGIIAQESHPIHLHGFNFFVVGQGIGNYDPQSSPSRFNLIDPVERNTVGVPSGGWAAIRFRADNPGVWFMHCHFEVHTSWGLKMAFLVENGKGAGESLLPPPRDLPKC